ncbi:hypothetical protein JCM19992_05930 [Thermostilla marina]
MLRHWWQGAVLGCALIALSVFGISPASGAIVSKLDGSQFWTPWDVRSDGTVEITETNPRSGLGSLELHLTDGDDKAGAIGMFFPTLGSLGELLDPASNLGFDWYRASSSTAPDHLVPALRLHASALLHDIATDNYTFTTIQIIWERTYRVSGAAAVDTWVTETGLQNDKFWIWADGLDAVDNSNVKTLADWMGTSGKFWNINGHTDVELKIDPNSTIVGGISVAAGSGWSGTFDGFVDNVTVKFDGKTTYTANFEPVPEPGTLVALLGMGGIGLGWIARRRRRV